MDTILEVITSEYTAMLVSVLVFVAIELKARKNKLGFVVGMFIQTYWIIWGITWGHSGQVTNSTLIFLMQVRSYRKWQKEEDRVKIEGKAK